MRSDRPTNYTEETTMYEIHDRKGKPLTKQPITDRTEALSVAKQLAASTGKSAYVKRATGNADKPFEIEFACL